MNKYDVMNALEHCVNPGDYCDDCPYHGMDYCYRHLCEDALALFQSTEDEHNVIASPAYHTAIIYTKRDNLSKWFAANSHLFISGGNMEYSEHYQKMREHYAQDRDVQLILLVRHEDVRIGGTIKNKCICRIKCPINPLPIKGEFECVSTGEMTRLLASMGWKYKEKVHYSMFK